MRKRILSLIMVLIMVFGMMPVSVLAVDTHPNSGYKTITANVPGEITVERHSTGMGTWGAYEAHVYPCVVTVPAGTTEIYVDAQDAEWFGGVQDDNYYTDEETWIEYYKLNAYSYDINTSTLTKYSSRFDATVDWDRDTPCIVTIPIKDFMEASNRYVALMDASGYPYDPLTFRFAAAEAPHEHSYEESITTAATCGKAGVKTFTCSGCGDSYTEEIAATGEHSYSEEVTTAATCGKAGVKTFTCSGCGDSYTEEIAATGEHSYTDGVCTVCGAADPDAEPAHTHSYTDGVCSCGAMENVVVYSGTDWPYSRYYIASLKLSGLQVDYVSGTDIYVNHTTASDAEFTMTATAGGSSSGNLGVNWNDDSTNTLTYSGSLTDGGATVKVYAYKAQGAGVSRSGTKTFTIHTSEPNEVPTLAEGVDAAVTETVTAPSTYELDLSTIFADADSDALSYTVSINGGSAAATEAAYSYAADVPGTYTLVFTATDGKTMNPPTHTVTLTVVNSTVTYDVPVTLPEGVGDVTFKAVNSVSGSTLTLGDTLTVEEGVIKVPENITRIAWECAGCVCGSAATTANTALELAKVSFAIAAGETTDTNATVKITAADGIAISGGAADSYLIAAGAGYTYAITPSSTYRSVTLTEQTAATGEVKVALEPKHFSVIAPAGSVVSAGTLSGSYAYSFAAPLSTVTEGNTVAYAFAPLSGNAFIRVQRPDDPDAVTYWDYKSSKADGQTITVTEAMLFMNDDGAFNDGTVYRNFEYYSFDLGDIYMNINPQGYFNMAVGGTKELNVFRNWQAIESYINSKIAQPDFDYEVVTIEGENVVSIVKDANNSGVATMTANSVGTAIVLVTYDAMYSEITAAGSMGGQGGPNRFTAIWPDRTGVFVVSVGKDGTSISSNLKCNGTAFDAEHSPQFYTGTAGASVSFIPDAGCDVTVSRGVVGSEKLSFGAFTKTGVTVDEETGEVTVSGLTTGRHIIRLEKNGVAAYQVVTATQVTASIVDSNGNKLTDESVVRPGDTVTVTVTGLTNPANKIATGYNTNAQITYLDQEGNSYKNSSGTSYGRYDFSSMPQAVTVTVPADWDQETLTLNGYISMGGFLGTSLGGHRSFTYTGRGMAEGSTPNNLNLGTLPEITLKIQTCNITLPEGEGYTVTATEDSTSPVVIGGSYSFTVDVAEGYDGSAMEVKANGTKLTADENGVYTVESVQAETAITVEGVVKEATSPVYPFTSVTADGETVADADIVSKGSFTLDGSGSDTYAGTVYTTDWYHITVPAGTENVEITYPSDADIFYFQHSDGSPAFAGYDAGIDADAIDAMTSATVKNRTLYNHGSVNSDGSYTVRLEAERYALTDSEGKGFALEKTDYSPISMVTFAFAPCPGHEYDSVVTEPTCTEDGYTTYTCTICGDSYTGDATKAPGHSYSEGTCTVCGEADPDYVAPAPGVTIPEGAPFTAIEGATAISDEGTVDYTGYSTYSGVPYYHVTVPAGTTEVKVTYTAESDVFLDGSSVYGYYADTTYWTGNGATMSGVQNDDGTVTVTLPLQLEVFDYNTYETFTVSFLKDDGNAIGPEANSFAPINFFTFEYGAAAPGSCEHSYTEEVTTEPTCGAVGVKTFTCSKCGDSYTESIAATGEHDYTEEVTTAPTCGKTGVKTFTCAKCGDSYTETVAATGEHTETAVVTAPTCTKYGYTTYTCSVCGASRTADSVEPTGEHNYVDGFCSDCGAADPSAAPTLTDGVYQIGTADELIWFATAVNNGETALQGALTANIDLSGKTWPGIGTDSKPFAGSFDGKDKTVNLGSAGVGLFGTVKGSSNTARAEIKNVITEGTVSAAAAVGGIAGFAQNANFTACINRADVTNSNKYAAGITCGLDSLNVSANLTISRCGNEGTISAGTAAAGIVTITKGGIAVSNCYNSGSVSGSGASTVTGGFGGIVGYAQGYKGAVTVSGCYNSGKISGNDNVAGIVGCLYNGNTVSNCFSIGEAAYAIAGRTYNNSNTVTNCYFLASASTAAAPAKTNNNLETNVSATALTGKEMSTADFVTQLSDANFQRSCPAPVFTWQSAAEHKLVDGACTECGYGALATYEVSIPESEMYTVTGETTVTEGGSYSFTVTIHEDYQTNSSFAVRVNGTVVSETDGVYTVTDVKGPLVITVEGVEKCPDSFTVSLPAKGNGYHVDAAEGSASPVEKGGSYSFTVTFPTGFRAGSDFKVLANGSTLTAVDGVYTIENVTADQTVTVTGVELIPYADTTSVTITVSSETMDFYRAPGSGDLLLLKDLEVPYFDLSLYGLQKYYYHPNSYDFTPYQAGNTELAYGVVTGMHALIYATEVFYLGYDAEDAGQGESYRTDTDGDGTSDFEEAISWTGGPGSSFMDLWGRGTNLNYYADYTYPMSSIDGIGATSDQIAIYDGYKIDVHFIENSAASGSDYGFLAVNDANGSFDGVNTDTVDYATVKQGDALTLTMFTAGEGSNYETTYWTTEGRKVYWTETSNVTDSITGWKRTDFGGLNADTLVTGANGLLTLDTTKIEPGTYYIAAEGGFREGGQVDNAGFVSRGKQAGPAVLCLTVLEGYIQPEPEVVLGDYDGDGELKMTDIAKTYKAFQEETELTDAQLAALDVNGNGKLDMSDFAKIYAAFKVQ